MATVEETHLLGCWRLKTLQACQAPACRVPATHALLVLRIGEIPCVITLCGPCKCTASDACNFDYTPADRRGKRSRYRGPKVAHGH